jgi:hypothetical protein
MTVRKLRDLIEEFLKDLTVSDKSFDSFCKWAWENHSRKIGSSDEAFFNKVKIELNGMGGIN